MMAGRVKSKVGSSYSAVKSGYKTGAFLLLTERFKKRMSMLFFRNIYNNVFTCEVANLTSLN